MAIVSTSKGIVTDKKARELNLGGEVLWDGGVAGVTCSFSRGGDCPVGKRSRLLEAFWVV